MILKGKCCLFEERKVHELRWHNFAIVEYPHILSSLNLLGEKNGYGLTSFQPHIHVDEEPLHH